MTDFDQRWIQDYEQNQQVRVRHCYRRMVGLLSLESCGRPKMRNSVLEGLRDRKLEDIQLDTLAIVSSRWVMLWDISKAKNDKRIWVSSTWRWWFVAELGMTVLRGVVGLYNMKSRGQGWMLEELHEGAGIQMIKSFQYWLRKNGLGNKVWFKR